MRTRLVSTLPPRAVSHQPIQSTHDFNPPTVFTAYTRTHHRIHDKTFSPHHECIKRTPLDSCPSHFLSDFTSHKSRRPRPKPQLINSLLASADSEAFREPVNWRALGLHDYPTIIKRPMDLGTVKLRLERGAYPTAEACAADVRLIWENCRTYNAGGVPRKLHKVSEGLFFVLLCARVGGCFCSCFRVVRVEGARPL